MTKIHIAVLMMVKNEHKRLHITLNSIKDFADSLIIYDTGSTDDTVQICKDFCEKYDIPLRLKEGVFENFATSRNVSLDFADTFEEVDYLLMLDTNDELRKGPELRKFAEENKESEKTCFLISQEWWSGTISKYFNSRFLKPRTGWRYVGVVHEYLKCDENVNDSKLGKIPPDIVIYQDRTQDDDKTGKRFVRDEALLKQEYIKDPTEPRTVFYLAQTYTCLGDSENAYYYYRLRTTLVGFYEERYEASYKCGDLAEKLGLDWYDAFVWYMKAFDLIPRAEPLIRIAEYYQKKNKWLLSYTYLDLACKLNFPAECILFIDRLIYDYKRWHLMGVVAYYAGFLNEGKIGCMKAIENGNKNGLNTQVDQDNLKIYLDKENESIKTPTTKKEFMENKKTELKKQFPDLNNKQLESRAKLLWKKK